MYCTCMCIYIHLDSNRVITMIHIPERKSRSRIKVESGKISVYLYYIHVHVHVSQANIHVPSMLAKGVETHRTNKQPQWLRNVHVNSQLKCLVCHLKSTCIFIILIKIVIENFQFFMESVIMTNKQEVFHKGQ